MNRPLATVVILTLAWLTSDRRIQAAPVIWSGLELTFVRSASGPSTNPANQDRITDNVILTRNATRGIYNIAQETSYNASSSPADTTWAFVANNAPGTSLTAANWEDLNFAGWEDANKSNPPATVGQNAVLHLITDDIYLDIRFLSWGQRGQGGFSYIRAVAPVVEFACGDIDQDLDVDSSDLLGFLANWTGDAPGSGQTFDNGDCDEDGDVDSSDLLSFLANWTGAVGAVLAAPRNPGLIEGAATGASLAAVPEPHGLALSALGLGLIVLRGRRPSKQHSLRKFH